MTAVNPSDVTDIHNAAAKGVASLFNIDPLTTVLVLGILALGWFALYMLKRDSKKSDDLLAAYIEQTKATIEFKEVLRAVLAQKG